MIDEPDVMGAAHLPAPMPTPVEWMAKYVTIGDESCRMLQT